MMFVPLKVLPNQVQLIKVKRTLDQKSPATTSVSKDYKLEILGSSPEGEAIFKYTNALSNIQ